MISPYSRVAWNFLRETDVWAQEFTSWDTVIVIDPEYNRSTLQGRGHSVCEDILKW